MANVGYSMIPRRQAVCEPRRIGLWKVGREIGSGASGRVKIARHSKTGQYAAIKIISKIMLNSRISLNRVADETEHTQLAIEREIVVMKLLDHPNLMRLYDVWETSTELYLILEYIQGGELFDYLCNNGKLPVPEALNYFQQIIAAMDYCHKFNIAHRDLKPENILLDKDFNIKIADFGMAAWQANNDGMLRTSCGSPHYAAPEIILGDMYNGSAADIWSCGIILFALLAGKLPFDDEDCATLLNKVKGGEYEIPSDMDPMAQDLIGRMLVKDVSQRISMCDIMAHPFFTLYPPKVDTRAIPNLVSATTSIGGTSIDPDIFANLRTLWHGTSDEKIVESLTNGEPTLQKGIYQLLVQYRVNHLELYRDEEEKILKDRLERKRSRKAKAMTAPNTASESAETCRSPSTMPPRDDPPTPRKATGQRSTSIRSSSGSLCHLPTPATGLQSPSPMSSPTSAASHWEPLPALTVPELEDDKMQAFFHQIVQHLNALQAKASASEYGWSPNPDPLPGASDDGNRMGTSTPPSTPAEKTTVNVYQERSSHPEIFGIGHYSGTRPLSVKRKPHRPNSTLVVDTSNKENIGEEDYLVIDEGGNVIKKSSLKRGKGRRAGLGEKRVHIVEPPTKERSKLIKKRSIKYPASPAISDASVVSSPTPFTLPPFSSSPKRTWLGNVFSFRPTPLSLLSMADVQTTRNECRRLLMAMDIRVVLENPENMGVLKCRLEEVRDPSGLMNTMKAVKFKVEFHGPQPFGRGGEEVLMISLTVFHEKGSTQTFREVCERLEQDWTLDGPDMKSYEPEDFDVGVPS